jgi:hypothetical protein
MPPPGDGGECPPDAGRAIKGGETIEAGPRDAGNAAVARYTSGGKHHYSRFLLIFFLAVVCSGLVLLLDITPVYILVVVAAFIPPMVFFTISPALTRHSIGPGGIVVRQGWYFSAEIPVANIAEVGLTDEEVPPKSISYSPRRRRLYVTLSAGPLAYIELRDAVPLPFSSGRPVGTMVVSLDDPEGFVRDAGQMLNVRTVQEKRCPECRRPIGEHPSEGPVTEAGPDRPSIEYIFLIHHDGRLVYQYSGGRSKPLSSSSVSGMLVIIQDFIKDAFKTEGGGLRKLEQGELTVMIESGGAAYLAVVFSGQNEPESLRDDMRATLREIDREFGDSLREWDGKVPDGIGKVISQVLWA